MPELPEVETIRHEFGVPVRIDVKLERNWLRRCRSMNPGSYILNRFKAQRPE